MTQGKNDTSTSPPTKLYARTHKQPVTTSFTSCSAILPNPPPPAPSMPTGIWIKDRKQFSVSEKTDKHTGKGALGNDFERVWLQSSRVQN